MSGKYAYIAIVNEYYEINDDANHPVAYTPSTFPPDVGVINVASYVHSDMNCNLNFRFDPTIPMSVNIDDSIFISDGAYAAYGYTTNRKFIYITTPTYFQFFSVNASFLDYIFPVSPPPVLSLPSLNGNGAEFMDGTSVTVSGRIPIFTVIRSFFSIYSDNGYTVHYDLESVDGHKLTAPEALLSVYTVIAP